RLCVEHVDAVKERRTSQILLDDIVGRQCCFQPSRRAQHVMHVAAHPWVTAKSTLYRRLALPDVVLVDRLGVEMPYHACDVLEPARQYHNPVSAELLDYIGHLKHNLSARSRSSCCGGCGGVLRVMSYSCAISRSSLISSSRVTGVARWVACASTISACASASRCAFVRRFLLRLTAQRSHFEKDMSRR